MKKLGKAGEIVKVAPGYFRNYLAPKGLASVATEAAKRRLKKLEAERAARAAEEKKAALAVAKKLEGLALTVSANTTDGKKLYGAVSVTDLLAAIEAQRGVKIERGQFGRRVRGQDRSRPRRFRQVQDHDPGRRRDRLSPGANLAQVAAAKCANRRPAAAIHFSKCRFNCGSASAAGRVSA